MRLLLILTLQVLAPNALGFVNNNQFRPLHNDNRRTTTTSLFDSPEPLAEEGSWQAFLDEETTGLIYYFDLKTGKSRRVWCLLLILLADLTEVTSCISHHFSLCSLIGTTTSHRGVAVGTTDGNISRSPSLEEETTGGR